MMAAESTVEQNLFGSLADTLWDNQPTESPLMPMRAQAWERYLELGLPDRRNELFRYIPLRKLFASDYQPAAPKESVTLPSAYAECDGTTLVFVNGFFRPDLSQTDALPSKVVILPLDEAIKTYSAFLQNQWNQELSKEKDPFAALNGALHSPGLFIYIPPKTVVEKPIEILHLIDIDAPSLMMPRTHLFLGKQAEAKLVRTQKTQGSAKVAVNGAISIALDDAAQLHYDHSILEAPRDTWQFEAVRATLKRDSRLMTLEATDGAETIRHDYSISLNGENGEASLNGVWMLAETRQAHANVHIEHVAPHCQSNQLFKSVLNEAGRSSFEGKIYIHPEAQQTLAYQLNNNLVLSDRAKADSKPNLEIFADDVKASHGSTVGQLDEEELFYLRARGISDHDARNILIYGFCKQVIDLIEFPSLQQEVTKRAKRYLTQG